MQWRRNTLKKINLILLLITISFSMSCFADYEFSYRASTHASCNSLDIRIYNHNDIVRWVSKKSFFIDQGQSVRYSDKDARIFVEVHQLRVFRTPRRTLPSDRIIWSGLLQQRQHLICTSPIVSDGSSCIVQ